MGPLRVVPDPSDERVRQLVCWPRAQRRAAPGARRVVPVALPPTTVATTTSTPSCLDGTWGVASTAWRWMREVLQISFRTTHYVQIWLPMQQAEPFLGGAILDSRLLEPDRLPYYAGGRTLQFHQAQAVVQGWITAALPLGSGDDVGDGYLWSVVQAIVWSLYERGHGVVGTTCAKSWLYRSTLAAGSGMNSPALEDVFPVQNMEDMDVVIEGVGAVPVGRCCVCVCVCVLGSSPAVLTL